MSPSAILISKPSVSFRTFIGLGHKALGRSPSAPSGACQRQLSDAERFLSCLAAMRDNYAPVGLKQSGATKDCQFLESTKGVVGAGNVPVGESGEELDLLETGVTDGTFIRTDHVRLRPMAYEQGDARRCRHDVPDAKVIDLAVEAGSPTGVSRGMTCSAPFARTHRPLTDTKGAVSGGQTVREGQFHPKQERSISASYLFKPKLSTVDRLTPTSPPIDTDKPLESRR